MAYSELIKNFEKIRSYIREFYVYGLKSREGFESKGSLRSYDDERRRIESWLGDYFGAVNTGVGKNAFISINSRAQHGNPLYKAFKAKTFTDGDITLHFILFDILHSPQIKLGINEIMDIMDREYLSHFETPMVFDQSTVRKKLKEYAEEGIIVCEKSGKKMLYSRAADVEIESLADAVEFFSEVAPCGVIGSFIADKTDLKQSAISFKHHYITGALDSEIVAMLLAAMHNKCAVTIVNANRKHASGIECRVVPLRILQSVQNGRQYLLAYVPQYRSFITYRVDYITAVKDQEPTPRFDELRQMLSGVEKNMWGANFKSNSCRKRKLEHVDFTIRIEDGEDYIVDRLEREKRTGTVEKVAENTYRFAIDVFDTTELIPWIRTFICRITRLNFSNRTAENNFKKEIEVMLKMYGVEGGNENGVQ